jgi:hypothetical protein
VGALVTPNPYRLAPGVWLTVDRPVPDPLRGRG